MDSKDNMAINEYTTITNEETIPKINNNRIEVSLDEKDAELLQTAMKTKEKDKATILKILCQRSNEQRQLIKKEYMRLYNIELIEKIKKEFKGEILEVVQGLLETPLDYDCRQINNAIVGVGTDELTLNDILCTRPNAIMQLISKKYPQLFKKTLPKAISSDCSGIYNKILQLLIQGNRSTCKEPDIVDCEKIANDLYLQGEKRAGTNEGLFINTMALKSPTEIIGIDFYYKRITGHSLEQAFKSEFSGDELDCFNTLYQSSLSNTKYFANRLYTALANNKISHVIRLLISRREIDLENILEMYKKDYKKEIREDIENKTKNDTKMILLELISLENDKEI